MAVTVTSPTISASIGDTWYTNGNVGIQVAGNTPKLQFNTTLTQGSSQGNIQKQVCVQPGSVSNGSPYVLNLITGTDPATGGIPNFTAVSRVMFQNLSNTPGQNLVLGGGSDSIFGSDQYTAYAGSISTDLGAIVISNPAEWNVLSSSAFNVTVTCVSGTSVQFALFILGR
jgi:hypothetical protein